MTAERTTKKTEVITNISPNVFMLAINLLFLYPEKHAAQQVILNLKSWTKKI